MKIKPQVLIVILCVSLVSMACYDPLFQRFDCYLSGGEMVSAGHPDYDDYCNYGKAEPAKPKDDQITVNDPSITDPDTTSQESVETASEAGSEDTAAQIETQNEDPSVLEAPEDPSQSTTSTYKGSTSIASEWFKAWGGQIITDEITIYVDQNSTVTGSILSIWESGRSNPIMGCVTEQTRTVTATLSGALTIQNNTIQMQLTHAHEILREGCPTGSETIVDSWTTDATVLVSGNKISGSSLDGLTFEVTKQ